ncbi:glycosyltransferase family 2 protein [Demequina oxidasica]|uniref:glycosyltransferase family 2 protein n=1 Tax=Demequina oxidasica TaxID=676199 RepID=UPI000786096F|nr:glycosyltransferase family 2 protein [Demequina oxidasica]
MSLNAASGAAARPDVEVTPGGVSDEANVDDAPNGETQRGKGYAKGAKAPKRRRRQWGSERPRPPLDIQEKPASTAATWLGGLGIVFTVIALCVYLAQTVISRVIDYGIQDSHFWFQTILYVGIMAMLIFSAYCYLLARQGALYRSRTHVRVPRAEIDAAMGASRPSLTVLVPSYAEEPSVVRATLLSAALQEYPGTRIVLLLDDPPTPKDDEARVSLEQCRALPTEIMDLLRVPFKRFSTSLDVYETATRIDGKSSPDEVRNLALDYVWGAQWLREQAASYTRESHADDFLAEEVFGGLAGDFEVTARALFRSLDERANLPAERLKQLGRRLVWTFDADLSSFERKAYAHLPHDANKAMNLNAYMGLMGRRVQAVQTKIGVVLRDTTAPDGPGVMDIPDTEFILTLDADSVLLREYCLRLIHHMETSGNERVGVIQTPYSAFRGAETRLERIAGATTDIQHILHQGLSYYDATFWVGANAVIRKSALNDIVEVSYVAGQPVYRYVQDRTVIEDTESSIDLIAKDWTLFNYPERLSYSATPPDFGSLVVQRARWANGGLLILPKFLRYVRRERKAGRRVPRASVALRFNYMASISWASVGLVLLLAFPFDDRLLSPVIVAAALPYFLAMSSDFKRLGYKRTDIFRVYAFNLLLLPVNLAGTLKSLQQAAAKSKIAFARTPKVANRTATPALYVVAAYLIAAWSIYTVANGVLAENWSNSAFALFNGLLTLYAIFAFIGFRNSIIDVFVGVAHWVKVPAKVRPAPADSEQPNEIDWEAVLYFGPDCDHAPGEQRATAVTSVPSERRGDTRAHHRG